ncbi:MAG: TRAP transporter small permease [Rhizobiales bacterium]|nr:TRAP transporter small permease [Hyphomicrobiales bacterium]
MRKYLDNLYTFSGAIAAGLIAIICLLVTTQVVLNLIAKIGGASVSFTIPSYADFAGYFLAASSFLALSYTFMRGGHIRVTLLFNMLGNGTVRLLAEVFSIAVCACTMVFATYYMALLVEQSYRFGDKSTGIVSIPIWIPQMPVLIGLAIFSIALIDVLLQTLRTRNTIIEYKESL